MYFVQIIESFTTEEVTSKVKLLASCIVVCSSLVEWCAFHGSIKTPLISLWLEILSTGLSTDQAAAIEVSLQNSKINFSRRDQDCIEAETSGVTILNILGELGYKVYGQSMAIERTGIGGRTVLVQRIVWTMGK